MAARQVVAQAVVVHWIADDTLSWLLSMQRCLELP